MNTPSVQVSEKIRCEPSEELLRSLQSDLKQRLSKNFTVTDKDKEIIICKDFGTFSEDAPNWFKSVYGFYTKYLGSTSAEVSFATSEKNNAYIITASIIGTVKNSKYVFALAVLSAFQGLGLFLTHIRGEWRPQYFWGIVQFLGAYVIGVSNTWLTEKQVQAVGNFIKQEFDEVRKRYED